MKKNKFVFIQILLFLALSSQVYSGEPSRDPSKQAHLIEQKKKAEGKVSLKFDDEVIETTQDQLTLVQAKKNTKSSKLYSKEYKFKQHTLQLLNEIGESQ